MKIKFVDLSKSKVDDFYYEYDFYPNRKFKDKIYLPIFSKECSGNWQFMKIFMDYDRENVQVIGCCTRNLFPLASVLCHKVIMHDAELKGFINNNIGESGFDRKKVWNDYKVGEHGGWTHHNPLDMKLDLSWRHLSYQLPIDIFEFIDSKTTYIDKMSYDIWSSGVHKEFESSKVVCELKKNRQSDIIKMIQNSDLSDRCVGLDKRCFQLRLIDQYGLENHYLAQQILASVEKGCAFVGIAGSGSFLCTNPLLNSIFAADDTYTNVSDITRKVKTKFNRHYYNQYTDGFQYSRGDDFPLRANTWRARAIEDVIRSYVPNGPAKNVEVEYP